MENFTPPQTDRLLRLNTIKTITGLGRTSIYSAISHKTFPRPIKLGRISAWSELEVLRWIEQQKNKRTNLS
jgi:predicted DNA-binding transcriptional regulator AlpA